LRARRRSQDLDADRHGRTPEVATVIAIGTPGRLAAADSTNLKVTSTTSIIAGDTSSFPSKITNFHFEFRDARSSSSARCA
jgi:hypothetical protein